MVRYGLWLGLGLVMGLIQAALIVHTVARLEPLALARVRLRVRLRVILRSLLRFALAFLVMAIAIRDSVVACALVGLGLLAGRWLLVVLMVSSRAVGSRV